MELQFWGGAIARILNCSQLINDTISGLAVLFANHVVLSVTHISVLKILSDLYIKSVNHAKLLICHVSMVSTLWGLHSI